MNPKTIEEKALTMSEVKVHLEKIKKRDGELNFRANKTEESLIAVLTKKPKEISEMKKRIEDLAIPRFKDFHVCKICDIEPETVEDLKLVLQGYTVTVTNDNLKKIVAAIKGV